MPFTLPAERTSQDLLQCLAQRCSFALYWLWIFKACQDSVSDFTLSFTCSRHGACVFREFVAFNQPVLNDIAEPAIRRRLPITLSLILNVNGKIELCWTINNFRCSANVKSLTPTDDDDWAFYTVTPVHRFHSNKFVVVSIKTQGEERATFVETEQDLHSFWTVVHCIDFVMLLEHLATAKYRHRRRIRPGRFPTVLRHLWHWGLHRREAPR